jgi:hypothetical protein
MGHPAMTPLIEPRTALGETRQVRGILFATAIVTSLLWGCVAAGATMTVGGAIGHAAHSSEAYFEAVRFVAAVMGLSVATIRVWRRRYAYSIRQVALWIEERVPTLRYALVTLLDRNGPTDPTVRQRLESIVNAVNLPAVALRVVIPAYVLVSVTVLVVAFLLANVMPLSATGAGRAAEPSAASARSTAGVRRLVGLSVHVVPPAYAHMHAFDLADPSTIVALVGSTITIRGPGSPDGLVAPIVVRASADGWAVEFPMPRHASALRLGDGSDSRIVALLPVLDAPPSVVLELPAADTTYRAAPKTIQLSAKATDDIGLADAWFECIISTGQSEGNFKSITDTIGHVQFSASRTGSLRATFSVALAPGSQLSVRALARDGNTVTGPGVGSSDTRTIRIARPEEYDSLAIAAAAPPILDKALMSQRMLVMQLEALVAKRKRPKSESLRLADVEQQLVQEVDDILNGAPAAGDSGGEPGEREDVDASKGAAGSATGSRERGYFQIAYQAMTDAARSLAVALPDTALPPARRALSALDSARVMNRLYLRGTPPTIVVNTARVRLAGPPGGPTSDTAAPAHRTPGPRADSLRAMVLRYIEQPSVRSDSLLLLQVGTAAAAPLDTALAAALGDAAAARNAVRLREALLRVRRAAAPPPKLTPGLLSP